MREGRIYEGPHSWRAPVPRRRRSRWGNVHLPRLQGTAALQADNGNLNSQIETADSADFADFEEVIYRG
jgi:hypothetical protein